MAILAEGGEDRRVGLYGFGAAAHILTQICCYQGREVYAFTRPGDAVAQNFALLLGAIWASGSHERPPITLDVAIIFASEGELIPLTLRAVRKGDRVICGGAIFPQCPTP